ncbi:MAG: hypothetical protein ACOH2P_12535 [Pseudomonas sp.]
MIFKAIQDFNISTRRIGDFCVNIETSEIIEQYVTSEFIAPTDPVKEPKLKAAWKTPQHALGPEQIQDALRLLIAANDPQDAPQKVESNVVPLKRVTRPLTVMANPIHHLIVLADVHPEHDLYDLPPQSWVEDYVMGACYTVAKASKGKLNVSPTHVYAAVKMPDISTAAVRNLTGLGKSQVALIAQCARLALAGMMLHLERNPQVRETLQAEVECIDACTSAYMDSQQARAA